MFRFIRHCVRIAIALTVAAVIAPASAQVPTAPADGIFAPVAQGSVLRFTITPQGDVDGLTLADGTQVNFPPHMSDELVAAIRPGDPVVIQGFAETQGTIKAFAISDTKTNQSVVEHPPVTPPLPPHLRNVGLSQLTVNGTIQRLSYGPRGEVNGAILDDGSAVRFPPDVGYQLVSLLQVGQGITATGYGTQNQYGRAIEVTAIGARGQPLQTLYGGPLSPVGR
jgi:hypothetical protein